MFQCAMLMDTEVNNLSFQTYISNGEKNNIWFWLTTHSSISVLNNLLLKAENRKIIGNLKKKMQTLKIKFQVYWEILQQVI